LRRRNSDRADAVQELDDVISDTVAGQLANPLDPQASQTGQKHCTPVCQAGQQTRRSGQYSLYEGLEPCRVGRAAEAAPLGTEHMDTTRPLEQLRGCMSRFMEWLDKHRE
jgi:RNA polymerase sigma-70 factor (ECF subfamily)